VKPFASRLPPREGVVSCTISVKPVTPAQAETQSPSKQIEPLTSRVPEVSVKNKLSGKVKLPASKVPAETEEAECPGFAAKAEENESKKHITIRRIVLL
jgi:hypothetical protein